MWKSSCGGCCRFVCLTLPLVRGLLFNTSPLSDILIAQSDMLLDLLTWIDDKKSLCDLKLTYNTTACPTTPHINKPDHVTHTTLKITGSYSNKFRATIDRYRVETCKPAFLNTISGDWTSQEYFFYRCTVHFEDSLSSHTNKCANYNILVYYLKSV
jgi:hypothetical protein